MTKHKRRVFRFTSVLAFLMVFVRGGIERVKRHKRPLLVLALVILLVGCGSFFSKSFRGVYHHKKGLTALEGGKYSAAVIEFKNAIQLNPKNTDTLYPLGMAYLQLGGIGNLQNSYRTFSVLESKKPERVDVKLKLGELLLVVNETNEALKKTDFVIQKEPKNVDGHMLRARIKGRDRQFKEAKEEYQKVIDLNPNLLPAYYEWASILAIEKDFEKAEALLNKAISLNPNMQNSYFVLANFYQSIRAPQKAEEQYQKAIKIAPKSKAGYLVLARFYLNQKRPDDAEKALTTAIRIDPKDEEPFLSLGDFYLQQRRTGEAEKAFLSAKLAQPKSGRGGKKLAALYLSLLKRNEAASEIASLPNDKESDSDVLFLNGGLSLLDKKSALAINQFRKVLATNPSYPEVHHYLGVAFALDGNSLQAKTEFLDAIKESPNDIRPHLALATLYMQSHTYNLADSEAREVLKRDPNNVAAYNLFADAAIAQKDLVKAEGISQRILSLSPKNHAAFYRMGIIRRTQKRDQDAILFFENALLEDPDAMNPISQIVSIYLGDKRPQKAIDLVTQQITLAPKNPRLYALQGRLYGGLGQLEKAEENFKKAILTDSLFMDSYIDLASLYFEEKKFDQGIAELEKALKINPKYVQAYMLKGKINDNLGHFEEARAAYEKVMELEPRHFSAANNLAFIYAEQGEKIDRALALATIAKENSPENPFISDTLGWVYYKKGVYFKAVSILKESAEKVQKNPIIYYHLGMAYAKRGEAGDAKLAREYLEKAISIDPKFSGSDVAKKTLASF